MEQMDLFEMIPHNYPDFNEMSEEEIVDYIATAIGVDFKKGSYDRYIGKMKDLELSVNQIIRELEVIKDYFMSESNASPVCIDEAIREEVRPHGKWIFRRGGYYKCDKCGEVERAEKNYCPNCGAKMDGGEEE